MLSAQALPEIQQAPIVAAVEIRSDAGRRGEEALVEALAIAPGQRLDQEAVRRTLSNVYATGWVSQAEIHRREDERGTVAVLVVRSHTWVESVRLEGELGLRSSDLEQVVEQGAGTPLYESRVLRSFYALQDFYEGEGYRQAQIRIDIRPLRERRVEVVFDIAAGQPATVADIELQGDLTPFNAAQLLAELRSRSGGPYSRRQAVADPERLRRYLAEQGYLKAEVQAQDSIYDEATHQLTLRLQIDLGPPVRVEIEGAKRASLARRGFLPFAVEQSYDSTLVSQSCERLRQSYQRRGHYLAVVRCEESEDEEGLVLTIHIEPGSTYRLAELLFRGNEYATSSRLLTLMSTKPVGAWGRGGKLVDQVLEEDLDNLRSFYLLEGFAEVEMGEPEIRVEDESIYLTLPIEEGTRQRLVSLSFEGMQALDGEQLQLPLQPAGPFHPVLLEDSVNLLRTLYEEAGYAAAMVTPRLDWNRERTLVEVTLEVEEGVRTTVDRVLIRGHQATRPELVRRFIDIQPGDPLSRRKRLETERELYRLGIFSRVDVEQAPPATLDGRRDLVVRLEEGRRWRLAYGFSYHSDDGFGGLLGVTRSNLAGRAGRLQLDLRANERDQRFRVLYDQPAVGRFRLPVTYSLFSQREERESFTVEDLGTQIAVTKDLPGVRLGLTYEYRLVDLSAESLDPLSLEREDREVQISSLTPNLFIDRRDDPLEASRGWTTALQLEYAFPLLEEDKEPSFLKFFWQQTQYFDLERYGVIAASLRLGAIEPLDRRFTPDPLVPPGLQSALVPASERFFAGGRTTHRAYERDRLGILGESLVQVGDRIVESGGNGLLLFNFDYRFPISGPVGGTVFADFGNVWADWRDLNLPDLEPGFGLGLRYQSPIGPLRLEVGWKTDPLPGERNPVFFLSFGNPF